ncbi:DUF418 domain-containing protein [Tunicatimonas pelagia]|uniref:DUF418 domain-containing protein n=1 Tax=Tunicatimonas pelagia TaxID=931531 RepID=UPI0026670BA6|nr:DUF418 domain-containing protein [Tunicatimonas pelagia]WKN41166.1 DUF418 domain-containing protein [Tunicatimonas pelagia]
MVTNQTSARKRIIGVDLARALAVIGMIIVNFKLVFGDDGAPWLQRTVSVLDGKAAATFVVLAGVGMAFMTNTALRNNDKVRLRVARKRIMKRAVFLFVLGLSYLLIWPADILHFYGVYMLIILLLLRSRASIILFVSLLLIVVYPLLMILWPYETGWDFKALEYEGFWTFSGFMRNLFFNGFHPVIPWASFMLVGYWLGKQDLHNDRVVKKIFWISLGVFLAIQGLSYGAIAVLSAGTPQVAQELTEIIGTSPMPPLPIYMFNGIAIASTVISGCILLAKSYENNRLVKALRKTGKLALTFYVAHVVVGMGVVELVNPAKMVHYSMLFSIIYAILFTIGCVLFAVYWLKFNQTGPLEGAMRKLTG